MNRVTTFSAKNLAFGISLTFLGASSALAAGDPPDCSIPVILKQALIAHPANDVVIFGIEEGRAAVTTAIHQWVQATDKIHAIEGLGKIRIAHEIAHELQYEISEVVNTLQRIVVGEPHGPTQTQAMEALTDVLRNNHLVQPAEETTYLANSQFQNGSARN